MDLLEKMGLIINPEEQIKELYHYTTHEGLLGILEKNEIWATDIEFLNDSAELSYTLNLAKTELHERSKKDTHNKNSEKINCLLDEIDNHKLTNISVSCLTEERDLLSQWRAYGGGSSGYSIGFKVSHLISLAGKNDYQLVKVEYDLKNQKNIMSRFIDKSLAEDFNTEPYRYGGESVSENGTRNCNILVQAIGGDFIKNLYSIAPCLKDPSFNEEREWRLISKIPPKDILFRTNKSMLIPYKNIDLGKKNDYLISVTVGPNLHMDLSIEAVKKLMYKFSFDEEGVFDSYIYQNIQVLESIIPYRVW